MRFSTYFVLTIIFVIVILCSVVDFLFKVDPYPHLNENRALNSLPKISLNLETIKDFPRLYQSYFNDHFGFRNALVRINFLLKYKLLNVSPSSQVVIGKEGWFFYKGDGSIEDYRGITHFDEDVLNKWARSYEMKRQWLEKQGIKYLLVLPPNKESIYSEYLPRHINKVRVKTGLDDLVDRLKKDKVVDLVDLRPALLKEKHNNLLYHKTDTHWNNYGAFVAYREIMKPVSEWYPQIHPFELTDFVVSKTKVAAGDLSKFVGGEEFLDDEEFIFKPKSAFLAYKSEVDKVYRDPFAWSKNDDRLPRALMFIDSFSENMVQFLSEDFKYIRYDYQAWGENTPIAEMIQKYKPDIVVEEIVERFVKNSKSDYFDNVDHSFSAKLPPALAGKSIISGGKVAVDTLNENNLGVINVKTKDGFDINGWAFWDSTKSVPATLFIELAPANKGVKFYAVATRCEREDLARGFNVPAYKNAGFKLKTGIDSVPPGEYQINVIQIVDGNPVLAASGKKVNRIN